MKIENFLRQSEIEYFKNISIKPYTTLKVGGVVKLICFPTSKQNLKNILLECNRLNYKYFILGMGANVFAQDEGYDGLIICTKKMNEIEVMGTELTASSGVNVVKVASVCLKKELGGFEYSTPIPGTIGGFVFMNAGRGPNTNTFTSNIIKSVEVFDGKSVFELSKNECEFGYRTSIFHKRKNWIILSATFSLVNRKRSEILKNKKHFMRLVSGQDRTTPNAGSVFEGGSTKYGGTFYDILEIKNYTIGGAKFSDHTMNWISNFDSASSQDIMRLIEFAKDTHIKHGKQIPELEWRIIK